MTKLDHNVYFRLLSTMAPHRKGLGTDAFTDAKWMPVMPNRI